MTQSVPMIFAQLKSSKAYEMLCAKAEDMIEREKKQFWDIEDRGEAEKQRLKSRHFEDFWGQLKVFIINSANQT